MSRTTASRLAVFTIALLALSACSLGRAARLAPFDPAEYAAYDQEGSATIAGEAFVTLEDGSKRRCAREEVTLTPATSYSAEWFTRDILGGERLEEADPRAAVYTRRTTSDAHGAFTFARLPAGSYYLTCVVPVVEPGGPARTTVEAVFARSHGAVAVEAGGTKTVVLTNDDIAAPAAGPRP